MIQKKLVDEIYLNFPELLIIGKYVKTDLKAGVHHAIFRVLEVKMFKTFKSSLKLIYFRSLCEKMT